MMDLHVHTTFSDGTCSIPEACKSAAAKKIPIIAISDHFTTTWKIKFINTLGLEVLPEYFRQIEVARTGAPIRILAGIEIDCESDLKAILNLPLRQFDFINFEYVKTLDQLKKIISLRNEPTLSSKPFILAHASFFNSVSKQNLNRFIDLLAQYNIAVELNSRYATYFLKAESNFRMLSEKEIKFSIGSDAHDSMSIGDVKQQYNFLGRINGTELKIK